MSIAWHVQSILTAGSPQPIFDTLKISFCQHLLSPSIASYDGRLSGVRNALLSHSDGARQRSPWYDPRTGVTDSQAYDRIRASNSGEMTVHEWGTRAHLASEDGGFTPSISARFAPAEHDEQTGDSSIPAIKAAKYVCRRRKPILSPIPGDGIEAGISADHHEFNRGFIRPRTPLSEHGGVDGAARERTRLYERGYFSSSNPESRVYDKEEGLEQSHTTVNSEALRL